MKKVVVVGSLNIDHILKVEKLPSIGETLISSSYSFSCGGKGANQAVAIARLGICVNMIGKVGEDKYGGLLVKNLSKSNVMVDDVIVCKNEKTGAAFITVDRIGNNTIIVAPGANHKLLIDDVRGKGKQLEGCDIVVLQMEIPKETVSYVIRLAKKMGKLVILNYAPAIDIDKSVLSEVDYLIVNETEFKYLVQADFELDRSEIAVNKLKEFFSGNLVVTLGDKGSVCINPEGKILKIPSYTAKSADSTGAGDAFIGGFTLGLVENKNLGDCAVLGNAAGALAVDKVGAQSSLPYKDELNNFLRHNGN